MTKRELLSLLKRLFRRDDLGDTEEQLDADVTPADLAVMRGLGELIETEILATEVEGSDAADAVIRDDEL
ncbi:MAG: hypothetical protein ACYTFA_17310 [Planctomycetota bacterium]|jgi:hypothetical protein